MKPVRLIVIVLVFALAIFFKLDGAFAQAYPAKPIKVIVPFAPGGSTDISCRILMKYFSKYLGADIAVANVAGAAGTVASMQAYESKPDGYTLLYHHLTLLTSYHTGVGKFDWDELTPICQMIKFYTVLTARGDAPWKNVQDLITDAKSRPGQIKWGVNIGAGLHFAALGFSTVTDTEYRYVAGGGDASQTTALLGGHIDVSTPNDEVIKQYVKEGKLKAMGVLAEERIKGMPDVPTLKEQGINAIFYFEPSLFGPPDMPVEIVNKIEEAAKKTVNDPEAQKDLEKIGMYPAYLNHEEFKKHLLELDAQIYKFARKGGLIPSRLKK